jgi:hypothetical protein
MAWPQMDRGRPGSGKTQPSGPTHFVRSGANVVQIWVRFASPRTDWRVLLLPHPGPSTGGTWSNTPNRFSLPITTLSPHCRPFASLASPVVVACRRQPLRAWYVYFASLFYIIIYCYSLIYFIFRDDTYVVSSVFTCLRIIGEFAAGVRILLEKRTVKIPYFWRSAISEKYPEIHIISEDENSQKEEARGAVGWAHHQVARDHPWPRRPVVRPP